MSTKITFNKVDLQYQTESLISTLIVNNGFDRKHRFTVEEGKEVSAKISKALEGNTILKPEEDLRYQDYYDSFQDIIDMYTLSILSRNFNRFSFSREDVEYEIANTIARNGKIVYRTKEVKVPVQAKPEKSTKDWTEIVKPATTVSEKEELPELREEILPEVENLSEEEVKEMINKELQKLMGNMDMVKISQLPEEQQWKEVAKAVITTYPQLDKDKVEKLLLDVNTGKATDEQFEELFTDMFKEVVKAQTKEEVQVEEPKEEAEPSVDLPTLESIKDNWDESVESFKKLLEINDIKCSYKVVKHLLKDYKKLLAIFNEEDSFNSILDMVNRKGVKYYQDLVDTKAKEDNDNKEKTPKVDIKEEKTEEPKEETIEDIKEEVPEVEAEIVKDIKFPLVEEDLTKDTREEIPEDGKPSLKYEEPKFNFKEGTKEAIKNFLNVSTKTDTKANVRKYISEKINKWEESFNYDIPETIPVYMITNIKNLKDEFPFIENTEDAGLNNNSITNFIASEFKEALKGMNKATLKELQEFAELCDVVDLMILDEYKAK